MIYERKQIIKKKKNEMTTKKKTKNQGDLVKIPPEEQVSSLINYYQKGAHEDALTLAFSITQEYPKYQFGWKFLGALLARGSMPTKALYANQRAVSLEPNDAEAHNNLGNTFRELNMLTEGEESFKQAIALQPDLVEAHSNLGNVLKQMGRLDEAKDSYDMAIVLKPEFAEAHNNLGTVLKAQRKFEEARSSYSRAIALRPEFAEAHSNLGNALKELGKLDEAESSYGNAIALKKDYVEAHYNLGNTLIERGKIEEAKASFKQATMLRTDFSDAFWNLSSLEKSISNSEYWVDKCLTADPNHIKAKITKAALRFYQGDRAQFDQLTKSKLNTHPCMRSISWAFTLPAIPSLYFNRWDFFDAVVNQSISSRPFYEFGVWRGEAFKYLIKTFKKGYGFDTFTGLPEDWGFEKAGTYSSDGNIPNIKGGEFVAGKFEDTLPKFFSTSRPLASVINFDADLYSSTLCALDNSNSVIDRYTVLIFDEFIMNDNWEQDEFKALNEFCLSKNCTYEVIAISFFTKQVAVKLAGI